MARYRPLQVLAAAVAALAALPANSQWLVRPTEAPKGWSFWGPAGSASRAARRSRAVAQVPVPASRPRYVAGQWTLRLAPGVTAASLEGVNKSVGARVLSSIPQLGAIVVSLPEEAASKAYAQDPRVLSVQRRLYRYPLLGAPNDPAYNDLDTSLPDDPSNATYFKWDSHMIRAAAGWSTWPNTYYTAASKGMNGVILAVIDTGIDETHPDFANAGNASTDWVHGGQLALSLDVTIKNGAMTAGAHDDYGHGTHVGGIAAAATNNARGTVGTGYSASIMSVKVVDAAGYGTDTDIAMGIVYAVDHGATILNLSLGSYDYSQVEQDAVNYAWRRGSLVVAAAGNDGTDKLNYPAAMTKVLAVSAVSRLTLATYSNYGNWVGVAAPGGDFDFDLNWFLGVYSTMPTYTVTLNDPLVYGAAQNYDYLMGTSMASPHVAGLAALYAGMKGYTRPTPGAPLEIWQSLQRGADGTGGWSPQFGYGVIDVPNTLQLDIDPNPRGDTVGCIVGQALYKGTPVINAEVVAKPVGGGVSFSASSRSDGGYRIMNLPAGTYNVTATYFGDQQKLYNVVVTAGCDIPGRDFNIAAYGSSLTLPPAVGVIGAVATLSATIRRTDTGVVLEDMPVTFLVDGVEVGTGISDAYGVAAYAFTVPVSMSSGDHPLVANFYGKGAYLPSTASSVLSVGDPVGTFMQSVDRSGVVGDIVSLRGYLYRADNNNALSGKTVGFRIDSTSVGTATTDASGRATLDYSITVTAGTHTIAASFGGDGTFGGSSASASLTATTAATWILLPDRTATIRDVVYLKAYLYRTGVGTEVVGKTVSFKVDSVAAGSGVTNDWGRALVTYYVPDGSGAGTRTITAEFGGSGGYLACSASAALVVAKAPMYVWIGGKTVSPGMAYNMRAYVRSLWDYAWQANKQITFRLDGSEVATALTNASGVATHSWTVPVGFAAGPHELRAEFAGDAWFKPHTGIATLNGS